MKIICTQENLKNGLLTTGKIISQNNTLPVLNNVLLKTENGLLKLSTTNLEIAISTFVRCKVEEEGETTVFSKTFTDLVNNLPNKNTVLETKKQELSIELDNYHTTIKTLPVDEFPIIPKIEGKVKLSIPSQQLKEAINQVLFAVSTNQTQPEITGVSLSAEGKNIVLTATDRYRLAEKKISLMEDMNTSTQIIIPQKTIAEIARLIGLSDEPVGLVLSETQISITTGHTEIISRLVDGQFPPYQEIIPDSFSTTIKVQKTPFINALKAGSVFSQNSNSITVKYSKEQQTLTVISESTDLGKSVVDIPSEIEGLSGELLLNHRYVIDCLSVIDSQKVVFKIVDDNSPSLILPEGKDDYQYLVMPIKS